MRNLPKDERLRGRARIGELFESGGRGAAKRIAARALPNELEMSRIVAVSGKGLGNAVKRNRMRRRIRAAYRLRKEGLPTGYDLAILARPGLMEAEWRDVVADVEKAVRRAVESAAGPLQSPPRP